MTGCRCLESGRFLSVDCSRHAEDEHAGWMRRWYEDHPRHRIVDVPRYPRGTFHVEQRCLCRRSSRHWNVRCPDVGFHGRHSEQGWHVDPPVFEEPYMRDAKVYHAEVMAGADPAGWWTRLHL